MTAEDTQSRVILERQIHDLESQCREQLTQLSSLKSKVSFLEPECTMLRSKVSALQAECTQQNGDLKQLRKEASHVRSQNWELEQKLGDLTVDYEEVRNILYDIRVVGMI